MNTKLKLFILCVLANGSLNSWPTGTTQEEVDNVTVKSSALFKKHFPNIVDGNEKLQTERATILQAIIDSKRIMPEETLMTYAEILDNKEQISSISTATKLAYLNLITQLCSNQDFNAKMRKPGQFSEHECEILKIYIAQPILKQLQQT